MTIIKKREVTRTSLNNGRVIITNTKKDIFYDGKALAEIDLTETTADKYFCDIRFIGSDEFYCIPLYKLNFEGVF